MRVAITGEEGFIGRNLAKMLVSRGHTFVPLAVNPEYETYSTVKMANLDMHTHPGERSVPCVWKNSAKDWANLLSSLNVDIIVHNAAVVGTDVVGMYPSEATNTNVLGTQNIVRAAELLDIPVSYLGTSVIYDVEKYQDSLITENSEKNPPTYYGQLKLAGENIVKGSKGKWNIIRPLFAYGGIGDMNSLIAKTFYAFLTGRKELLMFLDRNKIKEYIHVFDFCTAVVIALEKGLWGEDYNIASGNPYKAGEIEYLMNSALINEGFLDHTEANDGVKKILKWVPETDYLGNHRMSSEKFKQAAPEWDVDFDLYDGLESVLKDISENLQGSQYNPLAWLDKADEQGVELDEFFPDLSDS